MIRRLLVAQNHAVSAVIGVILMVSITAAVSGTMYAYVNGAIDVDTDSALQKIYAAQVQEGKVTIIKSGNAEWQELYLMAGGKKLVFMGKNGMVLAGESISFKDVIEDNGYLLKQGGTTPVSLVDKKSGNLIYQGNLKGTIDDPLPPPEEKDGEENTPPTFMGEFSPGDSEVGVVTPVELSVGVIDGDGDALTVTFYEAGTDEIIGQYVGVSSGETVSNNWEGLERSESYFWYVIVDDGTDSSQSDTMSFITSEYSYAMEGQEGEQEQGQDGGMAEVMGGGSSLGEPTIPRPFH